MTDETKASYDELLYLAVSQGDVIEKLEQKLKIAFNGLDKIYAIATFDSNPNKKRISKIAQETLDKINLETK